MNLSKLSVASKVKLAETTYFSNILRTLAKVSDSEIRQAVLMNPQTPEYVLLEFNQGGKYAC